MSFVLALAVALGGVGCDSSTNPLDDAETNYSLTVSGDLDLSFDGKAIHGAEPVPGGIAFVQSVSFIEGGGALRQFQILRRAPSTSFGGGPGTLGDIDESWSPAAMAAELGRWAVRARIQDSSGQVIRFFSSEGDIQISGSQSSPVMGEVSGTLRGVRTVDGEDEVVEIQVQASFNSVPSFLIN
ncbi:MAG: hypothetical protein EA352_06960 [Gemmatimonadales bacterium]|nr:MAG: hypothetical protein EA352_06960 [Gemmatimonadales bacterium]